MRRRLVQVSASRSGLAGAGCLRIDHGGGALRAVGDRGIAGIATLRIDHRDRRKVPTCGGIPEVASRSSVLALSRRAERLQKASTLGRTVRDPVPSACPGSASYWFPSTTAIAPCTVAKRTSCPGAAAQRGWGLLRCGHGVTGRGRGSGVFPGGAGSHQGCLPNNRLPSVPQCLDHLNAPSRLVNIS